MVAKVVSLRCAYAEAPDPGALLDETFTLKELRELHEAVAGAPSCVTPSGASFNDTASFTTISAGAAIAAYSFLRFDAVTTLTEETIKPRLTVPRAIMLVALIGGGIFAAVSYVTQLVHSGGVFEDSASATSSIARQIVGQLLAPCSWSACCPRWAVTPSCPRRSSARLNEKFHAPVANLVVAGSVGPDRDLLGRCHVDVVQQ